MDDKIVSIVSAVLGGVFGFALPHLANFLERTKRAKRMVNALERELLSVSVEIEKKLKWVGRDISEHLNEVDQDRIINANGMRLYLGEREEFVVPRVYWMAKYTEIVEVVSKNDFSDFYEMYRLVDGFEQKFREMKKTFETNIGEKDVMALACFNDLKGISKRLKRKNNRQVKLNI